MLIPVIIQPVRPSEIDTLLALGLKTFYDAFEHVNNPADFEAYTAVAFSREKLLSELDNHDSVFYFAMLDDEPVGYIKINYGRAQTEFQDGNAIEIERIYVLASQQGKQIGQQLLDFTINKATREKLQYIWLGVWEHNHNAYRFYERNGFTDFSTHYFMVGNDKQTDVLMRREL